MAYNLSVRVFVSVKDLNYAGHFCRQVKKGRIEQCYIVLQKISTFHMVLQSSLISDSRHVQEFKVLRTRPGLW